MKKQQTSKAYYQGVMPRLTLSPNDRSIIPRVMAEEAP